MGAISSFEGRHLSSFQWQEHIECACYMDLMNDDRGQMLDKLKLCESVNICVGPNNFAKVGNFRVNPRFHATSVGWNLG